MSENMGHENDGEIRLRMTGVRRLSEAVYIGLCHKIGTREEVSMRRDIADIRDVMKNKSDLFNGRMVMLSGSHREGFRLSGSDLDYMYWPRDHKVICDLSQAQHYRQPGTTLFLMECVEARPGFVFLHLLTPSHDRKVESSCVKVNDDFYISSTIYRKQILRDFSGKGYGEHGPCRNIALSHCEFDSADCFSCDYWPPLAASWIHRCSFWPSPAIVYEIIVSGCHFMAIGSKESPNEFLEWRLSFSQAEQKLVYAMNHCQFLVYGLLKLFLKEVINQGDEGNLCSYFMKTAVFWEIQDNSILLWCPQNILFCFWACFKRIMKWVYQGYCPNFFVAENNMFWNRICGSTQTALFLQLHKMYQEGLSCLLQCTSIRSYLYETLYNPRNVIHLHVNRESFEVDYAKNICLEIISDGCFSIFSEMKLLFRCLKAMEYLSKTNLTKYQGLVLHMQATECLTTTAFCVHKTNMGRNRSMYSPHMLSCKLLKIVSRSGCVFNMLHFAMLYYKTRRYTEALVLLDMTEFQFNQQNLTYNGNGSVEKYLVNIGGYCLLYACRINWFCQFYLSNKFEYIEELTLEQRVSERNRKPRLSVPPLVLLRMLYVLCYKHVNLERRQEALNKLYILVHYDVDRYILDELRDISYQILGNCQEICGDFSSAYESYDLSFGCLPFNNIMGASIIRMNHALAHIENVF